MWLSLCRGCTNLDAQGHICQSWESHPCPCRGDKRVPALWQQQYPGQIQHSQAVINTLVKHSLGQCRENVTSRWMAWGLRRIFSTAVWAKVRMIHCSLQARSKDLLSTGTRKAVIKMMLAASCMGLRQPVLVAKAQQGQVTVQSVWRCALRRLSRTFPAHCMHTANLLNQPTMPATAFSISFTPVQR